MDWIGACILAMVRQLIWKENPPIKGFFVGRRGRVFLYEDGFPGVMLWMLRVSLCENKQSKIL